MRNLGPSIGSTSGGEPQRSRCYALSNSAYANSASGGRCPGLLNGGVVAVLLLCSCCGGGSPNGTVTQVVECDDELSSDSLVDFAKKCSTAIGVDVPAFDCDAGTAVPENHLSGSYPSQLCDAPNVLNAVCDPGSRFQVLTQTTDVTTVAHCRKQDHAAGAYGDIAVIQYNQKNGATCFYQALEGLSPSTGPLSGKVTAPSEGNGPGKFPWLNPSETASIKCVRCHDNGPFIRSPYLAQLRNEAKNRVPGTNPGAGHWDQRFSWNKTIPYAFVGNDFQSWKVYSISVAGTGSGCIACHRLGLSSIHGVFQPSPGIGTAERLGLDATAAVQAHKNPHSADAPIWMKPGQIKYDATVETQAIAAASCASAIAKLGNDPSAPPLPAGCNSVQYGQGITCRNGPIRAVLNGATQSTPVSGRVDTVVDLGACQSGDCPIGYCYWRTVHGPFWQTSKSSIPIGDASYRGSFVRIYGEGGIWKSRAFSDTTGGPANAPPGGTVECSRFNEIVAVPDSTKCGSGFASISDPDGSNLSTAVDTGGSAATINVLSGLIGNVAQANAGRGGSDFLRVSESGGKVQLSQSHTDKPPSPLKVGPLTGESWADGCSSWSPIYAVKDVYSTSDVQLVPYPLSHDVRCYITGVTGAWSSTRSGATIQPYAEIYTGPAKDVRLRVSPAGAEDRVGAYASCIRLK